MSPYSYKNCFLQIIRLQIIYKQDLVWNKLQGFMRPKTPSTNQPTKLHKNLESHLDKLL